MTDNIIITIKIPTSRVCGKCSAENIKRVKKLVRDHTRQVVKELLEQINEAED